MRDLVIVGCGGLGRSTTVVIDAINAASSPDDQWRILGYLDDAPSPRNVELVTTHGHQILGSTFDANFLSGAHYVVGVGSGAVRQELADRLDAAGLKPATLVHPRASVGQKVSIGAGTIICGGAAIDPDVELGRHVLLNKNCIVGHDVTLSDFVTISPVSVVGGNSRIGLRSTLGMQSVTLPGVSIGSDVYVGAAACVVTDVESNVTVKGVPAR